MPDKVVGKVRRRQRAVAGELGVVDRSTSFESGKGREFVYNVFENTSCLVDMDEEPPHEINMEAVESALRLSSAFSAHVPDEIEPMRKEVVDGSDPSAFQRSMMVGHDGFVEAGGRKIGITSVFLEEESSGIESSSEDFVIYNVDRLGVPLIEIDTGPDIKSPEEAKQVALKIGMLLRLTGRKEDGFARAEVQRGIGTIRQDVNVSIEGGTRVEVKGLQQIDGVDLIIENEVARQVKLLEIKKDLASRKASVGDPVDVSDLFAATAAKMLRNSIDSGNAVMAAGLPGFAGAIGVELGPGRRLGSEISDYAKMAGVKGIIHSDEDLDKYGITAAEAESLRSRLGIGADGAFMLVTAKKEICIKAMKLACDRARMAMSEVPPETRAVLDAEKGTTRFMRPLPGGSRMYPETDANPIKVGKDLYKSILDTTIYAEERMGRIRKGLQNQQLAEQLISSPRLPMYEYVTSKSKCDRLVIAATILEKLKELERSGTEVDMKEDVMVDIFDRYGRGEITKAGIGEIIKGMPRSASDVDSAIAKKSLARISGDRLKELVEGMHGKAKGDVMREVMSKYRLNVDGEELRSMLGV